MAESKEVRVPDIGDFEGVEIIEVMVKAGDTVKAEDPLIMLESDKATMEVPAPEGGTVKEMKVKEGDKVSEGDLILMLEAGAAVADATPASAPAAPSSEPASPPPPASSGSAEVRVPDIGDFEGVEIIEVMVKAGDTVKAEDPLIMLESDKATMEVPAPQGGTVKEMKVKEGDKVSEGDVILVMAGGGSEQAEAPQSAPPAASPEPAAGKAEEKPATPASQPAPQPAAPQAAEKPAAPSPAQGDDQARLAAVNEQGFLKAHASPSVRRMARTLGVDLSQVQGSGRKGRILQEDVEQHVKAVMQSAGAPAQAGGGALPQMPEIDFSQFGEIETKALSRIRKLSAQNLHRAWLVVPHVTQFDHADITELESFRKSENGRIDTKLTLLPFLIKAAAAAIDTYPEFASSLDPAGENLIMKHYRHIGFAVDTPNGLLVPVIRDVDRKGIVELAAETRELAGKARKGKLSRNEMQGGVFSISSLGGLGGSAFTPIVNAPEVAILGISNSSMQPVWDGSQFVPRLMLPLSLSYDHRVIDGAKAARFTRHLADLLTDVRRLVL